MNGFEISKVAPVKMVDVAVELLERNGLSPNHVHHFHCHRANARMKKIIAKELNRRDFEPVELAQESRPWEPSDITMDLSEGNSGGASLALGLHQCDDSFTSGDQIICTAVGGGRNLGNWEVPIGEDDVHRKETDEGELTCGAVLFEVV
jgi:3-oxoacyl-[acyl-carrier-protein] synthase III